MVPVEDASASDNRVRIEAEVSGGRYVRHAGDDVRASELVLADGTAVGPAEVGVLAALGRPSARCTRRPRVALLTTGDELLGPSEPNRPGGVRNSNAFSVAALVERAGAELATADAVPDDPAALAAALERALEQDLTVVCGGVSVGDHDYVRPTLAEAGAEQVFWGLALRPGMPTWFGVRADGSRNAPVFGLPGNPVSAMVTFTLLARPAIGAMLDVTPTDPWRATAILDESYEKRPGRAHAVRCRLELRDDGWHVRPTKDQRSHVLTWMLGADALAIVPRASGSIDAGDRVDIELLE